MPEAQEFLFHSHRGMLNVSNPERRSNVVPRGTSKFWYIGEILVDILTRWIHDIFENFILAL